MHPFLSSCRIVQLINPYEQWSNPLVRELFVQTSTLKINGYGRKYPNGVIPVDTNSWFCDHFLLCRESDSGELQPIMGFQRVTLERSRKHYQPFPAHGLCKEADSHRHIEVVEKLMSRFDERPNKLSYTGCFTIDPELRTDRDLMGELSRLMVALHYLFHKEEGEGHEIITVAIVRFKIDEILMQYGFFPLLEDIDDTLPIEHVAGEEGRYMRGREFNSRMVALAESFVPLWNNRMVLARDCGAYLNKGSECDYDFAKISI